MESTSMGSENAIGSHLYRHILKAGDHDRRDACAIHFLRQRSTATRSCPSRRGYDDGGRSSTFHFPSHFFPHALHFSQRTAITASTKHVIDEALNPPFPLHVAQCIDRSPAVGILIHGPRV